MTPQEARKILLSGETILYLRVEEAMRFEIEALLLKRNETVAEAKEHIKEYLRGWCGTLPDQPYSWHGAMITNAVDVVAHMIAMELGIDLPNCSHTVNP